MNQLKVVGTSHISTQSARQIKKAFEEFKPDVIAVELDKRRLQSLLERRPGDKPHIPFALAKQVGITGWLFLKIGSWIQQRLAGIVKVQAGVDMLAAVKIAQEHQLPLLLADQDVMITVRRLSAAFTFKQKMRLVWDVLTAPFQREKIHIKLNKVPSAATIRKVMTLLKTRYPGLYNVLVIERNIVMAKKLKAIAKAKPDDKILLVIGAGHEEDLLPRLEDTFEIV